MPVQAIRKAARPPGPLRPPRQKQRLLLKALLQRTKRNQACAGRGISPEGTGTVLDSATGQEDDKQFYTITTADGNVFYLIIDGKRDSEKRLLLNGVTEEDLLSLAQQDNGGESAVRLSPATVRKKCEAGAVNTDCPVCKNDLNGCLGKVTEEPAPEETEQPEAEAEKSGGNTGMIIFLVIALGLLAARLLLQDRAPETAGGYGRGRVRG